MTTHEDLVRLWGSTGVVRRSTASLGGVPLPEEATRTLVEVGLPVDADPFFHLVDPVVVETPEHGSQVQFGSDLGTALCVDPDTGIVRAISVSQSYPVRFVNQTLGRFVECLYEVSLARARFQDLTDEEVDLLIETLAAKLAGVDPDVFSDPDTWWAVIFEQMRDGLL